MSSIVTSPNPSLVAILLVTHSRNGRPQIVYHYPPDPLRPEASDVAHNLDSYDESSSSGDSDSTSEEDGPNPASNGSRGQKWRGTTSQTTPMKEEGDDDDIVSHAQRNGHSDD